MTSKLRKVKKMVYNELMCVPATRGNDRLLIMKIYRDYFGIKDESFFEVLSRDDLPNFESIRRCRAKLQAEHAYLRPNETVQGFRREKENEYFRFVTEGGHNGEQIGAF